MDNRIKLELYNIMKTQEEIKNKLEKGTKENYQITLMVVGMSIMLSGFSIWAQTLGPERLSVISSPANYLIFYGILIAIIGGAAGWKHYRTLLKIILWTLVALLVIALSWLILIFINLWPF